MRTPTVNGEPWSFYPFGGILEEETTFGGISIPTTLRAQESNGTLADWAPFTL